MSRKYLRRSVEVAIRVRNLEDPMQGDLQFDVLDLSQGGAFLRSDLLLEVGEEVEVTFRLPGEIRQIRARARVAWATRQSDHKGVAGMGLEFVDVGAQDRSAIAAFVRTAR
ncbi:MAG: PilZ domain-containing protein [Myxococcota bacterium]